MMFLLCFCGPASRTLTEKLNKEIAVKLDKNMNRNDCRGRLQKSSYKPTPIRGYTQATAQVYGTFKLPKFSVDSAVSKVLRLRS